MIFRAGFIHLGWSLLRKIHKDYGKKAFWLSYAAGSAFVTYHTWPDSEKKWQEIKRLWAERQKTKEREAALNEAVDKRFQGLK